MIDVIGLLTDCSRPRKYWTDMKKRIEDEGFLEVSAKCGQLKMTASDGKQRMTDADTETLLRIIQSVPSPKVEPVKQWLARVGARRLDEVNRPPDAAEVSREVKGVPKPSLDAPALEWAEYHEQLAVVPPSGGGGIRCSVSRSRRATSSSSRRRRQQYRVV